MGKTIINFRLLLASFLCFFLSGRISLADGSFGDNAATYKFVTFSTTDSLKQISENNGMLVTCNSSATSVGFLTTKSGIYSFYRMGTSTFLTNIQNQGSYTITESVDVTRNGIVFAKIYFKQKPALIIEKIRIKGTAIKNDTLTICESLEDLKLNLDIYDNAQATQPVCSLIPDTYYFRLFVNNKYVAKYTNRKDGDKIKIKAYKFTSENVGGLGCTDSYCLQQSKYDTVTSQTITVRLKKNEKLDKPTFVNNINAICPGDTAKLVRDLNVKHIYYASNVSTSNVTTLDSSAGTKWLKPATVYLRSINVKSDGCYAISDTVNIKQSNCSFSLVRGRVYQAAPNNNSYTYKKGDITFANVKVSLKVPNTTKYVYAFTNSDGIYEFRIDSIFKKSGYLDVKVIDSDLSASSNSANYSVGGSQYFPIDIQVSELRSNDLSVNINSGRNRPGFTVPVYMNVVNKGKTANGGKLSLELDTQYTFVSARPTPKSVQGNTLYWDVDTLVSGQIQFFTAYVQLNPSQPLNSVLRAVMKVTPNVKDVDTTNNQFTLGSVVTGSYDPNEVIVTPKGSGAQGYIRDTTGLNYVINFQNMGTDTAFTVVVKSKLSPYLDFTTFKMLGTSHPYEMSLRGDTLVWTFNDILLPDDKINEPGSHGQIRYKIRQKSGNAELSEIKTGAGIYFDYNAPVETNVALNTVSNLQACKATSSSIKQLIACKETSVTVNGTVYNTTGTFIQNLTNKAGCDSVITLEVANQQLPDYRTTLNGSTLTASQSNVSYEWFACDNAGVVLGTNQSFTPEISGAYAVKLSVNGCNSISPCISVNLTVTDVKDNLSNNTVSAVYPNPASSVIHVVLKEKADVKISLTDVTGGQVYQGEINGEVVDITTDGLSNGVYILQIRGEAINATHRIVIVK